jgi:predicted RNase H-like nuclease (RuvC/YqgF family)
MNKTTILVIAVAVGLVAYALNLTMPELFNDKVEVEAYSNLEPRPEEVPKIEVPELQAGDGTETKDVRPNLPEMKLSTGSRKILEEKLKEEKGMVKSRKKWIEETKVEIANLKELLTTVPKESKLHQTFSNELETKEHYLTSLHKRLLAAEKEVMLLETALGGK